MHQDPSSFPRNLSYSRAISPDSDQLQKEFVPVRYQGNNIVVHTTDLKNRGFVQYTAGAGLSMALVGGVLILDGSTEWGVCSLVGGVAMLGASAIVAWTTKSGVLATQQPTQV